MKRNWRLITCFALVSLSRSVLCDSFKFRFSSCIESKRCLISSGKSFPAIVARRSLHVLLDMIMANHTDVYPKSRSRWSILSLWPIPSLWRVTFSKSKAFTCSNCIRFFSASSLFCLLSLSTSASSPILSSFTESRRLARMSSWSLLTRVTLYPEVRD